MKSLITDNCYFFHAEKGGNEGLLFKRKRQRKSNCCPFGRKPDANKIKRIEAERPGKERRIIDSAKQGKENQGVTAWRIPQDL